MNQDRRPHPPSPARHLSRRQLLHAAAAGLSVATLPASLTACNGSSGNADKPKGIEGVKQLQLGPETAGVTYPKNYVGPRASEKKPFHDGSKTFRVVVTQDAQYIGKWQQNKFSQWLEKRTGLKIEYQAVSTADDDMSKVNAMLASGDLPDAFLNMPFSADQLSLYGQQGVLVALDDYIETYAPELRRARKDYPDLASLQTATDGKTYQFGGVNDCYHCRCGMSRGWINKKYVEKVGGKIPETTDELRELLKLFKEQDPSGTGKMIPFASKGEDPIDRFIMNAFLYNPGGDSNGGWIRLADGRVEFVAHREEWREALRFLRTLFDDGTLGREVFTMTGEALLRAGNQGRLGFVRAWGWGDFMDIEYKKGAPWRDYVAVPPLKGPDGVQYTAWDHYGYATNGLVITNACSNPELLVQWADYQMELEAILSSTSGVKGENWNWAEPGDRSIKDDQAVWKHDVWPAPLGQSWVENAVRYQSNDYRLSQYIDPKQPDFEKDLYDLSADYEKFAAPKDMQLPPVIFDESAAAQKADTAVAIESHVLQSLAKFAIGELDINDDAAWRSYVKKFDAMGLPAYLDLYQQAYESQHR